MELKCIMCYSNSGFGEFTKEAYNYLIKTHGKEIADMVLTCKDGLKGWNVETEKEEELYFPVEDTKEARFNKYLIEVVENIKTKYCIQKGTIEIDSYDGADKYVKIIF